MSFVHGSDERLQHTGKVAVPEPSAGTLFAAAKDDVVAQAEACRHSRKARASDDVRAHACQVAFAGFGELVEQHGGDDHAKHRIAEKLEPFVRCRAGVGFVQIRGVRERLTEEVSRQRLYTEPFDQAAINGCSGQGHAPSRPPGEKDWLAVPPEGRTDELLKRYDHRERVPRQSRFL